MTYRYNDPFKIPDASGAVQVVNDTPFCAMIIFAHPDDAEIGAGATLAKWASDGSKIIYVQSTSGSSGSNDLSMTSDKIVAIRRTEQKAAAEIIGTSHIEILDHDDGDLKTSREYLDQIVRLIRKHRPEIVLAHDPYRYNGFNHADHRAVGLMSMDAVYPYARDHLHFPHHMREGLEPWKVKHLMFWGSDKPNAIVDITKSLPLKINALMKHESQISGLTSSTDVETRLRNRAANIASGFNFMYGEVFRKLTARA